MATNTTTATEVARVVREGLAKRKITQRDAAERSGIPLVTLHRRLTGATPFSVSELCAVAAMLDMSVSDLVLSAEGQVA